ncbi:hypothetical protein Tco_1093968 [Tanacetum coccineum]|uniref:Uncharacterized protein n=1 Tax=Tanacetum coccineum TaxID=301880 RepID=A0ABQ5IE78_9ASTR
MELVLEHTQQGISYEVSVEMGPTYAVSDFTWLIADIEAQVSWNPVIRGKPPFPLKILKGSCFISHRDSIQFISSLYSELDDMKSGFLNSLVHSLCALSTLRRSSLRTASTAAKPCQGDSSPFYLITGRNSRRFRNSDEYNHDPEKCEHVGPKVTTSHGGNNTTRMIWRFTVADDLKECSKITQVKGTMLKDYYTMTPKAKLTPIKDISPMVTNMRIRGRVISKW